ncbi:unnamed protein product [Prunus armeniaca]|uniref:Uncharacterized protein n=1 Tax=Prunus armeniaca TaxID=36596 RepID=A0A6J5XMK0_PRUAR|nr:unnamed protein product [Prunus armeniaca]
MHTAVDCCVYFGPIGFGCYCAGLLVGDALSFCARLIAWTVYRTLRRIVEPVPVGMGARLPAPTHKWIVSAQRVLRVGHRVFRHGKRPHRAANNRCCYDWAVLQTTAFLCLPPGGRSGSRSARVLSYHTHVNRGRLEVYPTVQPFARSPYTTWVCDDS